jgi:hypothetical protein
MFIIRMSIICYNFIEDNSLSCTKCNIFHQSGIKRYSSFLRISYDKIETKHYFLDMLYRRVSFRMFVLYIYR